MIGIVIGSWGLVHLTKAEGPSCEEAISQLNRYLQIVGAARNQAEAQVATLQVTVERLTKEAAEWKVKAAKAEKKE